MKKVIVTVLITVIIILIALVVYIYSGVYDIGQKPHNALTAWAISSAKDNSISRRTKNIIIPKMDDTAAFIVGFVHYNEMCSVCHGGPGVEPEELAKGLYPKPPEFYHSKDMPGTAETFWIIKNGIKFTAMPAFGPTHDDQKIWAMTDFLLNKLNKMSPEEFQQWQQKYAGMHDDD